MSTLLLENPQAANLSYNCPLEVTTHEAWYNLGIILIQSGQFEEAIATVDQVLEREPDLYQLWYNRGIALDKAGRHEEAIASYDQAVKLQPDFYPAWYNRGNALVNLKQYEAAKVSYDNALNLKPNLHQVGTTEVMFCLAYNAVSKPSLAIKTP